MEINMHDCTLRNNQIGDKNKMLVLSDNQRIMSEEKWIELERVLREQLNKKSLQEEQRLSLKSMLHHVKQRDEGKLKKVVKENAGNVVMNVISDLLSFGLLETIKALQL